MSQMGDKPSRSSGFVLRITSLAAIGGFLFGYDTGVVSGAMILIKREFELDDLWQEAIVSVTVGAAAVFAAVGGFVSERWGRRRTIMASSLLFTIASVLLALSQGRWTLLGGRLVVGMGLGLSSMAVPMYIVEAAPMEQRGRLVTLQNLGVTFGQFFASTIDGVFSYVPQGWRWMMGLAAIPAAVQLVGFVFLPESPRWLLEKGRVAEARSVLRRIRDSDDEAERELDQVLGSYREVEEERKRKGVRGPIILAMLRSTPLRKALVVGCSLQLFQQVTGINTIMYYAATIIEMAGVKDMHTQIWLAAAVASVNFLCTFIGLYLVERIGRRPLTLYSLAGVTASLLLLAFGFQLMASESPGVRAQPRLPSPWTNGSCAAAATCDACITQAACGFCYDSSAALFNGSCLPVDPEKAGVSLAGRCNGSLSSESSVTWAYNWCPTAYSWVIVAGLVAYLFCFAAGMGPMPWTINSELYPQWARSSGNAASTAVNWTFNLLVSATFLSLMEALTKQGAYYLYTTVGILASLFLFWVLPETRGQRLEDCETLFARPWLSTARPSAASEGGEYAPLRKALRRSLRRSPTSSGASSPSSSPDQLS